MLLTRHRLCRVPITDVPASQVRVGDLIRIDDPQAHQVLDISRGDDGRIALTVAPIGLNKAERTRAVVSADTLVTRVGTANDRA